DEAKLAKSEAQFLRIFVLNALVSSASDKSFNGMEVGERSEALEKIGFSQRTTEPVLKDLIAKRFLFSRSHQAYSRGSVLIARRLAGYLVRELIGKFVFNETVMFDTFIDDESTWNKIRALMKEVYREHNITRKFHMRKNASSLFFDYAEKQIQKLV